MKKTILIISIAVMSIFASGCSLTGNYTYSCTSTVTNASGIVAKTTYDIEHKDDDVKKVKITYDYTLDEDYTVTGNNVDTDIDGLNADTDGNSDSDNDEIVDGAVGDAIDGIVNFVTDTVLDISGVRERHNTVGTRYGTMSGLKITTDEDTNDHYKVTYEIDMNAITDDDLANFNVDRSFDTIKTNYSEQGLVCK